MSHDNQSVESSNAAIPQEYEGPTQRSGYDKNLDLNKKSVELYKEGDEVYLKVARGVDPSPYKIYRVLGDAQYKLSRDGKCDGKVYPQEDLRTVP